MVDEATLLERGTPEQGLETEPVPGKMTNGSDLFRGRLVLGDHTATRQTDGSEAITKAPRQEGVLGWEAIATIALETGGFGILLKRPLRRAEA